MTWAQIASLCAATVVAGMYLWPLLPRVKGSPDLLRHLKNIIAVRDTYPDANVVAACNALMEALLEIK